MTAPKRPRASTAPTIKHELADIQERLSLIRDGVEDLRDRLLGNGDKAGYVERLRVVEADQVRHQAFVDESRKTMPDLLERTRNTEKWIEEHREFIRDAPGRIKDVEEWTGEQRDFKRDMNRKMWGGMIGGVFSILVALFLAWQT